MDLYINTVNKLGFSTAKIIDTNKIVFNADLRKSCEMNTCRAYGTNYGCPPDIGTPEYCIQKLKSFSKAVIFQLIVPLEDSFDFESMTKGKDDFTIMVKNLRKELEKHKDKILLLGAGPCLICKTCAKKNNLPCNFPQEMISSIEAHCVEVNRTALASGLKYNNGINTMTYTGLLLFDE